MDKSLDDELVRLRDDWKPIQAIGLIRRELGLSVPASKQYLREHPAWREALAQWDKTLDDLERELVDDGRDASAK